MESYTPLLEKLRVPQPSLQKFAVLKIFSKLASAPKYLDSDSEPGRDAISRCLLSDSSAVVDQSVRELCRLVADAKMEVPRGMLELQSALEGCEPRFVDLFVKGLGFLVRLGFRRNVKWRSVSSESHPFVKVLSCRIEVQSELVQQVLLLLVHAKKLAMDDTCEFLRPFLNFSILRIPFSDSASAMFARNLISAMVSLCCSLSVEAIPIFKLLIECLKHVSCRDSEESRFFIEFAEQMVDAQVVLLKHLAGKGLMNSEAQLCSVELLETILLVCSGHKNSYWIEPIAEVSKRLLSAQKDIGFQYVPKLSSITLTLFNILIRAELEHEQLAILKLLHLLVKWKYEHEIIDGGMSFAPSEELLLTFPVICLLSSPSKTVKGAATNFLITIEKIIVEHVVTPTNKSTEEDQVSPMSTPGSIVFRLLQRQWFQDHNSPSSLFINFSYSERSDNKGIDDTQNSWAYLLKNFCQSIVDRRKSLQPLTPPQETFVSEMPLLLSAVSGVLLMHQSLGSITVDLLSTIAIMDPKMGTQFLVAILFYSNIFTKKGVIGQNMLLKLLGMLPALASHNGMTPLIIQTIMPMIQNDSKPTLYGTAIRLLCQTWEMNDRAFGSLQGVLLPKGLTKFKSDRDICFSIATSIKDVCRKDADRGVDLILSVSACIESPDHTIQALGFESLAHLCEADVIDFYTAWDVILKYVQDFSTNPILTHSICRLLRWGATDAEAYPEASKDVLGILWCIITSRFAGQQSQWEKARISALEALAQYEVSYTEQKLPDFKETYPELLFSETNQHVWGAMEELQVKIIAYEHSSRRRVRKEKRVAGNKIEKLLDVFPQLIFPSGKDNNSSKLSGAALSCLSFSPKDVNSQQISKGKREVHAGYEKALLELASSLELSRNILVALISLQSWKAFICRWLRADILLSDAKAPSTNLAKTENAANDILKRMIRIANDSIPRSSANIALAIGALCAVLPPSVHTVKSSASKFLLDWLFQHKHEHRQWSAAISLGLISSCLHITDHKQKFQIITGLLEILCNSKSTLVKGACGVGLGFSCQDLLTRIDAPDNSDLGEKMNKISETDLLGKIVSTLLLTISQFTRFSPDLTEILSAYFPPSKYGVNADIYTELPHEIADELEDDIWGVSGIVIGLANSIGAIYRAGLHNAVIKMKKLIVSWMSHVCTLSVGSSLALPSIVGFCQKMELMDMKEVEELMNGYRETISELLSVTRSDIFHQSFLMASCIGAGNLLACVLNEGIFSVEMQFVRNLMELFRNCYLNPHPPLVHLGAMLGVVNSMGADAGNLFQMHPQTVKQHSGHEMKESKRLIGPLFSSAVSEPHLTPLMQDIFLIAHNTDSHQIQQYAAWAVSLLRNQVWSKGSLTLDVSDQADAVTTKYSSQNFADDSAVMKLSLWLMYLNASGVKTGGTVHINSAITVLRCLSRAPRLPDLDWGAIIRRCMRYGAQIAELLMKDNPYGKGVLREECIRFSLAHASQFDSLLNFLDELSDLSRFRALELNLQSYLLIHIADLVKVFSGSRLEKLFDDLTTYMSSFHTYEADQRRVLRKSCWKGLFQLDEASMDSLPYVSKVEKCMEVLFSLLPAQADGEEWCDGIRCLSKARSSWLLNFLEVSHSDIRKSDQFTDALKKIHAKVKLVSIGCFTSTELGKIKTLLLNANSQVSGTWEALVEVARALQHVEGSVQRQWLMDVVEISCVSAHPSTAMRFLALLSGSRCKYMPLLILDRHTVLSDLPVTLSSLLSEPSWREISKPVALNLCASTERITNWVAALDSKERPTEVGQRIDECENEMAGFLLRILHRTCLSLKDHLPFENQLELANMVVP